jgi:heme-degrading monooxygenase HmoA
MGSFLCWSDQAAGSFGPLRAFYAKEQRHKSPGSNLCPVDLCIASAQISDSQPNGRVHASLLSISSKGKGMSSIAMNRFKVVLGKEEEFEEVWRQREGRLNEMKGYQEFRMLKGPATDDYRLYSSHTTWASEEDFIAWTKSQQFRDAHKNAGNSGTKGLMAGPPQFEGFQTVLHESV